MITVRNLRSRNLTIGALEIPPGITSVIGPNGSGKTTFLKLCAGITIPEAGSILIDGVPPRRTTTGWVNEFPDRNIVFGRVFDEIASPLRFRHDEEIRIRSRTSAVMETMGISRLADRHVRELSGGEKALVALAAAIAAEPLVLILDEYDSHLDYGRTRQVHDILEALPVPYIIRCTQDMETAGSGDFLLFFQNDTVACSGPPATVFPRLATTPFYPMSWRCGYSDRP